MRRLPSLNAVRAFEAAARLGSLKLAAHELSVTPSAISHQVRSLEEYFGTPLFHREGRRVRLTANAADFLRSMTQALDQISAASQRMTRRPQGSLLNIVVAPTFANGWLVPRMSLFQAEHPELEIRMSTATRMTDFAGTDLDLAIAYSPGEIPAEVSAVWLMAEHCVPVCSPDYAREYGPLEHAQDIARCTLLHALPRMGQWRNWLKVAGIEDVDGERGPKFQSTPLALEAAESGLGVAIANREFVEERVRRGRLVTPLRVEVPSESGYYLLCPRRYEDEPKVVAFRDWLLATMAESEAPAEDLVSPPSGNDW